MKISIRSHSLWAILPLFASAVIGSGSAFAEPASGCMTLAGERVSLQQGTSASHITGAVPLLAGETLNLRMIPSGGTPAGAGSIALREGDETDAPILSGSAPQEAAFTVPLDGLYSFEFRSNGAGALAFEVQCGMRAATPSPSASPQAFVQRRAGRLLGGESAATSLRRRADKPKTINEAVKKNTVLDDTGQPVQVSVTTSVQDLAAAEGQRFANEKLDFWIEGRVSQFEQKLNDGGLKYSAEGSAGAFNIGADYLLRPGLMVGALVQFDQYREEYDRLDSASDSSGILFGPYASVRLAPDLIFDAQIAWGDSDNDTELPDGTRLTYQTERQLLRGQLSGNRNLLGLQFTPTLALSIVEDRFARPGDVSYDATGADGSVFGRFGVGSAVSYRITLDNGGFVQPTAALSTGWDLDGFGALDLDDTDFGNEIGAKAEAGITLGTMDGVSIQATGAIEGLGEEDYSAWSGRLSLTAPLN